MPLAVCSTSNEKAVSNIVETLMGPERAKKFQIFAGDVVEKKKLSLDIYLLAKDTMGLSADRTMVIEDSHIGLKRRQVRGHELRRDEELLHRRGGLHAADAIVEELGDDERPAPASPSRSSCASPAPARNE